MIGSRVYPAGSVHFFFRRMTARPLTGEGTDRRKAFVFKRNEGERA